MNTNANTKTLTDPQASAAKLESSWSGHNIEAAAGAMSPTVKCAMAAALMGFITLGIVGAYLIQTASEPKSGSRTHTLSAD